MKTLAEALHDVTHVKTEWQSEHQGELTRIVGYVWECDDDYCRCSQARIDADFENRTDRRWRVPRLLWEGEFHTDGEPGAIDELAAKKAQLEADEPDMAQRIEWLL